jgi:gamma-glutamylcyclotransferase (GGCT)/AIG2-like uncharacterized protein YtfP
VYIAAIDAYGAARCRLALDAAGVSNTMQAAPARIRTVQEREGMRAAAGPRYPEHRMIHRLFVYGTLAPGQPNAHVLGDVPGSWEPASVTGTLLAEGWGAAIGYPGIVLDPRGETVPGLVFSSDALPEHWARLDDFEGDGYRRVLTTARLDDGSTVEACIYCLNEAVPAPARRDGD